jgi:exopolysaccharide biosynthesis polyprenyl glycosylphosphotransferase
VISLRATERAALVAADFAGGCIAFAGVFWVRYRSGWIPQELDPDVQIGNVFSPGIILTLGWMFLFLLHGLYRDWFLESRSKQILVLAQACFLGTAGLALLLAGSDLVQMIPQGRWLGAFTRSRLVTVGAYGILMLAVTGTLRLSVQAITRTILRHGRVWKARCCWVPTSRGRKCSTDCFRCRSWACVHSCSLIPTERRTGSDFEGLRIAGKYADLPRVLDETGARHVVICHATRSHNEILRILSHLEDRQAVVYVIPDLMDVISGHLRTMTLHRAQLAGAAPAPPSGLAGGAEEDHGPGIFHRHPGAAFPALLLAMIAIKLDSPGPIFYSQERIGQYGRRFRVHKLRTMRTDAEMAGPQWAGKQDNRITRVGKFLRKSRLDEVPQLWCVFRGDMALVGPRPEREYFIEKLRDQVPLYMRRLKMKPGLTGWAQVTLGYDNSIEDVKKKVMADLWYFENLSLALDIQILVRTIWVVLTGKGAN